MKTQSTDKRHLLVKTALELFYQQGIHAVGINEILKVSGIARKTLYSYFDGKNGLIAATVELRDQYFQDWLNARLDTVPAGFMALEAMFAALDDWFNERVAELGPFRGCFFINTSAEYSQPDCQIFASCQRHKQAVRNLVREHIAICCAGHEHARLEALTDGLLQLKEGAIVSAHIMGDKQAATTAWQMAQLLLANHMVHR